MELGEGLYISGEVKTIEDGIAKPVLIVSHGFRGHRLWGFWPDVTTRFAEQGFYTISYDFSRVSARKEELGEQAVAEASTVSTELLDLESLISELFQGALPLSKEADTVRLALLGHSRAGGSSIIFASEHEQVKAVAVWNGGGTPSLPPRDSSNPPLSLQEQALVKDVEVNAERFNITDKFAQLQIPVLLVQGAKDNERLLAQNQFLQEAAPHQHFVSIAGGDHFFGAADPYEGSTRQLDEAVEDTIQFFKTVFSGKA
ncbi:alpha/beta hydrolase family protein [Paenibacillus solisilvae]|uniref:Alpha/beta hydrolase family protein n=1 Tax=Paenibacillus solisilvae TaxID=2486751 RepID=A0ABW0VXR4_9BACL